jgi:hypothetical protein
MEQLLELMNKLLDSFGTIESRLDKKAEQTDFVRLEADVADFGNRIGGLEKESRTRDEQGDKITAALATLEKRMDDLVRKENGGGGASATATEAVDGKIVREATERTVERQLREDRAIEDRKNNIILYRVPESEASEFSTRMKEDRRFVDDMCAEVFGIKLEDEITKMFRLGKKSEDSETARPVLISFRDQKTKEEILNKTRMLNEAEAKFKAIGIAQDLTPGQREEAKKMVREAVEQLVSEGEQPENYRIFVTYRGTQPKLVKKKKT